MNDLTGIFASRPNNRITLADAFFFFSALPAASVQRFQGGGGGGGGGGGEGSPLA